MDHIGAGAGNGAPQRNGVGLVPNHEGIPRVRPTAAPTPNRGGSLYLDKMVRRVGRIRRATGSNDPAVRDAISRRIDDLVEAGRFDVLHDVRSGKLALLDLIHGGVDGGVGGATAEPVPRWIYFIRRPDTGAVKIGIAANPAKRFIQIQSSNDVPLDLVLVIPGDFDTERDLHTAFARYRKFGEWFHGERDMLDWIAARKKASEPIDLPYCPAPYVPSGDPGPARLPGDRHGGGR